MSTRYVLHDSIGSGGMATVHLGHLHAPLGFTRVVAIKRLHPALSHQPEFAAMLVDEARITARVRHLNVVPTLDVFLENGECFLVMEYVEGESLAKLLRSASQAEVAAPLSVVSAVLSGVLHGLHAAHVAKSGNGEPLGIIHRDVSPQNILVGGDGIARVFDFGVAKALGRLQQTRAGEFKGKLPYLAPEQFGEGKLDRRVDVYAASVTLWEALTTRRLFDGGSEEEVFGKILQSRIPAPSELRAEVPAALDDVVLRGLARAPGDRFASAAEMALALEQAVPPASAREVVAWLESLAGEALAKRAALVTAIDSGSKAATAAEAAPTAPEASPAAAPAVAPPALALPAVAPPALTPAAVAAAAPRSPALAATAPLDTTVQPNIAADFPSLTVTQRMTVPLRTKSRRALPPAERVANGASEAPAPADAAAAPGSLGLGNATPPPHALPLVTEPHRPRRVAVRATVGAAVLVCSLAAPAFGWMALTARSEPAHASAGAPATKITPAQLEEASPPRPIELAETAPGPSSSAQPAAQAAPSSPSKTNAAAVAARPVPKAAVAVTPSSPAPSKPRVPVKAKPAAKSDYLSSAPYSQRR